MIVDQVSDELYARHTADVDAAAHARRDYEERRGRVHQDDELWEAWSAAFVEWFVVERIDPDHHVPLAALTFRELPDDDARKPVVRALVTSQRSLFEVRAIRSGRVELLDLLGGAELHVVEQRALHGVEIGDVAELRLVGVGDDIRFGRTFIYHPRAARDAIVERARAMFAQGASRRAVIDQIAHVRTQLARYRHMSPARLYRAGSRGSRIA